MKSSKHLVPVITLLLVAALVGSYLWMDSCRASAAVATENLKTCLRLAAQIKALRNGPQRAGAEARSATELAKLIETSVRKAGLPTTSLVQIDPQPPRRLGSTAYQEQATRLELRDATLGQLLVLIPSLTEEASGADLADLRLSAPRDDLTTGRAETWTAEMTLTHLLYVP